MKTPVAPKSGIGIGFAPNEYPKWYAFSACPGAPAEKESIQSRRYRSSRQMKGWGWMLFSGVISLLLGGLALFPWPETAPWLLGLLFGVNLLVSGWWRLTFSAGLNEAPLSSEPPR